MLWDVPQTWPALASNASAAYALCMYAPSVSGVNLGYYVEWGGLLGSSASTSSELNQLASWLTSSVVAVGSAPGPRNIQFANGWAIMVAAHAVPQLQVANAPGGANASTPGLPVADGFAFLLASDPANAVFLATAAVSVSFSRAAVYSLSIALAKVNGSTIAPVATAPLATAP